MAFTKINAAGIGTTETVTVDGLTVINNESIGGNLTVTGNATISGVLTYEDVTNVDSVGLITARNGIVVGSGITLSKDGDVFFTGIATGNGSGLTALNASNLASGTVPTARLGSGTASSSTFLRGDSTFATVTSTTINNNASTKFITGSNSANTLDAEANLSYNNSVVTFSSSNLLIDKSTNPTVTAKETAGDKEVQLRANTTGGLLRTAGSYPLVLGTNQTEKARITSAGNLALGNDGSFPIYTETNDRNFILGTGSDDTAIQLHSGTDKFGGLYFGDATSGGDRYVGYVEYKHDDNYLRFSTGGSERLRIDSSGRLLLGTTTEGYSSADDLTVATTGHTGITIRTGTGSLGTLAFSDGTSGTDEYDGYIQYAQDNRYMDFATGGGNIRLRIDSSGRVLVGRTASRMVGGSTTYAKLQVAGTSQSESSISLVNNETSAAAPFIFFGKTRGNSVGESGIVQDGDALGGLSFIGADGNDTNNRTAEITAVVNGTPANNTIPTDIVFSTSTANAGQLAEVLRLDKNGHARFGASGDANDAAWSHGTYNNTEVAIDGGGGYAVLHMRGDGAGSTATRWSMGVGDDKFYMAYDDVDGEHRIVVNGSGVVSIPVGIELGSGVDGTPVGNILDDYEEGTFTPSISSGRTGSITYQSQTGFYTKIGNRVFLQVYMQMSGGSTNGSTFQIGGLPFTNISTTAYEGGGYHTYQAGFFDSGDPRDNHPWLALGQSQVNFHKTSNGSGVTGNETSTSQNYLIFHLQHIVA